MSRIRVSSWAWTAVLAASMFSPCRAEEAKAGPLTVERLREAARACAEEERGEAPLRFLDELTEGDEPAILAFLDEEAARALPNDESDVARRLENLYGILLRHLGRQGSRAAVPVLVRSLLGTNGVLWEQWGDSASAIVGLSGRVEVTEEDLRPLTGSADGVASSIGRQVLAFVKYEGVPSDLDRVIEGYRRMKTDLEKEAGWIHMWEMVAEERGFSLMTAKDPKTILAFIEDSRRRCEDLRRALAEGRMGSTDWQHLQVRESYLQVLAIEALGQGTGPESFEPLVEVLEAEAGYTEIAAAFQLHRLTGAHFPLTGYVDVGNSRNNVHLNVLAARAWRKWERVFPERPIEVPAVRPESPEARVEAFRRDGLRGSGAEFARDAGEVLEELLSSRDRRVLEMLVAVLRTKTLAEAQVERLIAAAESDDSDAHRLYLWMALASSGSAAARRHLEEALVRGADEGEVVEFVEAMPSPGRAEVRLLTKLYETRESEGLRDAIARRLCVDHYEARIDEAVQDQFFASIVERSPVERHVLEVVRRAERRAGTNTVALRLAETALSREWSPEGRRALLLIAVQISPEVWLPRALRAEEPEETRLGALRTYSDSISGDRHLSSYAAEKLLPSLQEAAEGDPSPDVQALAKRIAERLQESTKRRR